MTSKAIDTIAKSLGNLKGQIGIDERTRRACVSAVEDAILLRSKMLNDPTTLIEFRVNAKTAGKPNA